MSELREREGGRERERGGERERGKEREGGGGREGWREGGKEGWIPKYNIKRTKKLCTLHVTKMVDTLKQNTHQYNHRISLNRLRAYYSFQRSYWCAV